MTDRERIESAFDLILSAVQTFGSALGLMDRGYSGDALDAEGNETVRAAFRLAPELYDLLPWLAGKVRAGASVADDGFTIRAEVEAARGRLPPRL